MSEIFTAAELMALDLPELKRVVNPIGPEGLIVFAGKPKSGKSLLALSTALAVAGGGRALEHYGVTQGEVLYLALEDSARRLQERMWAMLNGQRVPGNLHLTLSWPKLDNDGLTQMDNFLIAHPKCNLIVVDTLGKVRPYPKHGSGNVYQEDYDLLGLLKEIADRHNVATVVNHHMRKALALDWIDSISGTAGISGSADTLWVLDRHRGSRDGVLKVTGRDVEEDELSLTYDAPTLSWRYEGQMQEVKRSEERQSIIDVLRHSGEPLSPLAISQILGKEQANVRQLLFQMKKAGEVHPLGNGKYININNTDNGNNVDNGPNIPNESRRVSMNPDTFM